MTTVVQRTAVVCEDDPISQRIGCAALERTGYRIVARVDTVMDAAQAAHVFQPDVMILDLMLPWVSGEFAISVIKEEAPGCAIVVCSSFDTQSALDSGATFAVSKGALSELETVLSRLADTNGAA